MALAGMERVLDARLSDPARRGTPAMLSIDSRVQSIVESELANQVSLMSADGGTGIVMDVQTGEVIALASAPTFNPNAYGHSDPNALLNRATMSVYELGSVFKPITIAAALDAHVITSLHQQWDASPLFVGGSEIHDDQEHAPTLDISHIITFSSNIAARRGSPTRWAASGCRQPCAASASTGGPNSSCASAQCRCSRANTASRR